jgi:hypothetical protein
MRDTSGTPDRNSEGRPHDDFAARRRVWSDFPDGLSPGYQRLLGLASATEELQGPMGELKHALLCGSHQRQDDPQRLIAAPYPGFLLCQDTYFAGNLKGLGEVKGPGSLFVQSVVDAHCSLAFAKLYPWGSALAAVEILHDRVLPFYAQQGLKIERLLTDNGREYGWRMDALYESFLLLEGIEHMRCDGLPAAAENPVCAQFHQILEEEFLGPALRKGFYLHVDTLQSDLDAFLKHYNCERACPGIRTQGRTPSRAFLDALEARGHSVTEAQCKSEKNPFASRTP